MFKGAGNQTRNPPTGKRDDNERQPQFQETEQLGIKPALAIQAGPGHQAMVRTDLNNCRFLASITKASPLTRSDIPHIKPNPLISVIMP
jgi:hypothetical protein